MTAPGRPRVPVVVDAEFVDELEDAGNRRAATLPDSSLAGRVRTIEDAGQRMLAGIAGFADALSDVATGVDRRSLPARRRKPPR